MRGVSRRAMLRAALAAAALALPQSVRRLAIQAQSGAGSLHLPVIVARPSPTTSPTPSPTPSVEPSPVSPGPSPTMEPRPPSGPVVGDGHVVHVHAAGATHWDYGSNYYGDYVDQSVVDAMMDVGVMTLTGLGSVAEAWRAIVPEYVPGRAVAVKVNMNNCYHCELPHVGCQEWQLALNALIHPVNAVVSGLKRAYPAFEERDVWVYEGTIGNSPPESRRRISSRVTAGCRYPGVRFFDTGCVEPAGYDSTSPTALVTWRPPAGIPTPPAMQVTDVLVEASYVINMPIMRRHGGAGVTLAFKNHFGSVANCSPLHDWLLRDELYPAGVVYSALVDLYLNPNIAGKTVLTVGDGLYGNWESNTTKAKPWRTFGGAAANSLFLAADPVAIDCVMTDLLHAEMAVMPEADGYLRVAAQAGLGVYERGDPWGGGYASIRYDRREV